MSIDSTEIFPFIPFNGQTPRERGYEHGTILSDRIDKAIKVYRQQFSKDNNHDEKFILNLCEEYYRGVSLFSQDYLEELNSIAVSSKQDPLWITALNCRLEILNHLALARENECTVLYDKNTCQLAENWDWLQEFEHLAFVNYIKSSQILQMIEPGNLGKIGLNSHGIGVTLNFVDPLIHSRNSSHIPIHVKLRTVLDRAETLEQAVEIFEQNGPGFGGHSLIGDDQGQCCSVELPGDKVQFIRNQPYHTNHFLATDNYKGFVGTPRYQHSMNRFQRIEQLWDSRQSLQSILFDYDDKTQINPICRLYKVADIGLVGTVCSIIMNLKERTMNITKGNPRQNQEFIQYKIDKNCIDKIQ